MAPGDRERDATCGARSSTDEQAAAAASSPEAAAEHGEPQALAGTLLCFHATPPRRGLPAGRFHRHGMAWRGRRRRRAFVDRLLPRTWPSR